MSTTPAAVSQSTSGIETKRKAEEPKALSVEEALEQYFPDTAKKYLQWKKEPYSLPRSEAEKLRKEVVSALKIIIPTYGVSIKSDTETLPALVSTLSENQIYNLIKRPFPAFAYEYLQLKKRADWTWPRRDKEIQKLTPLVVTLILNQVEIKKSADLLETKKITDSVLRLSEDRVLEKYFPDISARNLQWKRNPSSLSSSQADALKREKIAALANVELQNQKISKLLKSSPDELLSLYLNSETVRRKIYRSEKTIDQLVKDFQEGKTVLENNISKFSPELRKAVLNALASGILPCYIIEACNLCALNSYYFPIVLKFLSNEEIDKKMIDEIFSLKLFEVLGLKARTFVRTFFDGEVGEKLYLSLFEQMSEEVLILIKASFTPAKIIEIIRDFELYETILNAVTAGVPHVAEAYSLSPLSFTFSAVLNALAKGVPYPHVVQAFSFSKVGSKCLSTFESKFIATLKFMKAGIDSKTIGEILSLGLIPLEPENVLKLMKGSFSFVEMSALIPSSYFEASKRSSYNGTAAVSLSDKGLSKAAIIKAAKNGLISWELGHSCEEALIQTHQNGCDVLKLLDTIDQKGWRILEEGCKRKISIQSLLKYLELKDNLHNAYDYYEICDLFERGLNPEEVVWALKHFVFRKILTDRSLTIPKDILLRITSEDKKINEILNIEVGFCETDVWAVISVFTREFKRIIDLNLKSDLKTGSEHWQHLLTNVIPKLRFSHIEILEEARKAKLELTFEQSMHPGIIDIFAVMKKTKGSFEEVSNLDASRRKVLKLFGIPPEKTSSEPQGITLAQVTPKNWKWTHKHSLAILSDVPYALIAGKSVQDEVFKKLDEEFSASCDASSPQVSVSTQSSQGPLLMSVPAQQAVGAGDASGSVSQLSLGSDTSAGAVKVKESPKS